MKAIQEIEKTLHWVDTEAPALTPGSVRIEVRATAVNRADLVQRSGGYPPPPGASQILGLECAGVVSEVADGVDWPAIGDEVCCLLSGGGYAEQVVVPAGHVLPLPSGIELITAAALPEVSTTAWLNLRQEGELKATDRVLIHAGMSGVGSIAIQLCNAWGNPVAVTVGGKEKCRRALDLGADIAVDRKDGPWFEKATAAGKFDLILDPVGGDYLEDNIRALNPGGRLVCIGLMGGNRGTLGLGALLVKRLRVIGSVLRSRSDQEKTAILEGLKNEVWPLLENKSVVPIIETTLPIQEAEAAHRLLASNQTVGKIILTV